jgi:phosphoserine phosphatase RsbU/P
MHRATDQTPQPRQSSPRPLACAETWAGNERAASLLALPGLSVWSQSAPAGPGNAGGDVHYVSLCPDCIIARVALADVSGHGPAVAALGDMLRELMHRYLHDLGQIGLMRDLNQAVREGLDGVHYATMVAVGWHSRRGLLVVTNAGHPPPLWYRAARQEWSWLDRRSTSPRERPTGVPLGLFADADYDRTVVRLEPGDLVVLYSDGASESTSPAGDELGREGLRAIARDADVSSAEAFGTQLAAALRDFRGGEESSDDQTIIVLERGAA